LETSQLKRTTLIYSERGVQRVGCQGLALDRMVVSDSVHDQMNGSDLIGLRSVRNSEKSGAEGF